MKRFNSDKVPMSHHLVPLSDKQKARNRSARGIKKLWASDIERSNAVKADRPFITEVRADYKPPRLRGNSGTRLSPEKRAMVELRRSGRAEFFASLGVKV